MTTPTFDLAAQVLAVGMTYRDIVVTGVQELPRPGEESYAESLHEMWGGIATMARVCRALGLDTALCTAIGDDDASLRLLADLANLGIDTSATRAHAGWTLPVTVALSLPGDRAMVTVEEPPPADLTAHLNAARLRMDAIIADLRDPALPWLARAREDGALVYASRGFDSTGDWGEAALAGIEACDVWMLNDLEARAFTGEADPLAAARALSARVPTVIVTRGPLGMVGVDARTGEQASVTAFPVTPRSTTGAGDSTLAAYVFASQRPGTALAERLDLAAFIASAILDQPAGAAQPVTVVDLLARIPERANARLARIRELLG